MCAVADVYDTLVTDRPYRKRRSMDEALAELRRVAGTQLDADLVRCLEAVIRRESANEGIDPSIDGGLEEFQQLITALTEDRGFL
jgi:HD-GYP domain-containing protein (c-di-GMP phosphodiesterase class II)